MGTHKKKEEDNVQNNLDMESAIKENNMKWMKRGRVRIRKLK